MERLYRMLDPKRTLLFFMTDPARADLGTVCRWMRGDPPRATGDREREGAASTGDVEWDVIEEKVAELAADPRSVRLYQESLPVCGREGHFVKELANAGSRNHRLLVRLMEKGAILMGTESPDLLAETHELLRVLLVRSRSGGEAGDAGGMMLARFLLVWRDQYIANRINETLREGETGILFLSRLHSLVDRLHEDIRIVYPACVPSGG